MGVHNDADAHNAHGEMGATPGIYFDELSRVRVLDMAKNEETEKLKEECQG